MLGTLTEAIKALAPWPVVDGFFVIVITFLTGLALYVGNKDRKREAPKTGFVDFPMFLMGGPVHDMMGAVHDMAEQSRNTNTLLQRLVEMEEENNRLLEEIRNYQVMYGTYQPPKAPRR